MMLTKVHQSRFGTQTLLASKTPLSSHENISSIAPFHQRTVTTTTTVKKTNGGRGGSLRVNAIANPFTVLTSKGQTVSVKGVVSVKVLAAGLLTNVGLTSGLTNLVAGTFQLELVSTDASKAGIKGNAREISRTVNEIRYQCSFDVPTNFGEVGAVVVENEIINEMYLNNIVLSNLPSGPVTITCNSWVHSKFSNPNPRVFFTNKSYLPSQTPSGLKKLREQDLQSLRGDGKGERKINDRIYDYDTYNDLGFPDLSSKLARPVLGGAERPYPRRCRTGRGPTRADPSSEKRAILNYVPKDEAFSAIKTVTFGANTLSSVLNSLIPTLETALVDTDLGFPHFTRIDSLYEQGVPIPGNQGIFKLVLPRLVKAVKEGVEDVLLFEQPEQMDSMALRSFLILLFFNFLLQVANDQFIYILGDRFSWFKDEEFSRQTLAGLNPYSIQLVTEWPMKSKLDPNVYGPAESAITTEIVEREIKGIMTVEEAMEQKKLFVIDYHDLLLPYVEKVRQLDNTTLYGSRALFFQCEDSTLRPIAIELTRPIMDGKPQWRQVFTPAWDATNAWLWKFAMAHVAAHDSGYHQLVIHWLRTHCCTEPYIIAANRQLSAMHPIYRLLEPHFRYTMEINALARSALICAKGVIESTFTPGKYSMELSSAAYDQLWRFDMEALPADLIRRGMAVEDPNAEHGVKLTIEDYPFANDGLVLWDAIKTWVSDYVNHYYPDANSIEADAELQAWWTEVRTKGHEDKKDEPWWPVLNTAESLIQTLSTIIWVSSGHHAAVNFGQYGYAGYFPNRPTITRTNMPNEDPTEEDFKKFIEKPERALLDCFPSQIQATKVMAVLDVLSSHSPDEEYIGNKMEPSWSDDRVIKAAFERFAGKLKEMDGIVDARNADPNLKNRFGAGIVPYELLKPSSPSSGATMMGVPNSISI
ncbi:linoleate 13S-lipoxygenase [Ranunculus cassubicifolius]